MEQQRIPGPYGDIFIVNTPTLDRVAQQLYVQQQQRQLRQQQENKALDGMMQKEFANIRSVDTPEVVNAYNNYKQLKKNLLFNKDLQRDPMAYNQAQQQANEAYLRMQQTMNKSIEVKDMTKTMNTDRFKNPDAYSDDYGERAATLMNTPVSKLQAHPQYGDLSNWDSYRYQGSNTNFNDIVAKVYDKKNKIVGKEEPLDDKGIQFRAPVYEYGTTPAQVYEGLTNSLDHKTERDAAYKWKQLTPDVIQDIEQKYKAMPQAKWEQMGLPGPQSIDLKGGSDAEKYMRLLAMQNAVNTNPRLVNYENRTSEKSKMDYDFWKDKVMEGIRFGHQKELKEKDQKDVNNWVANYWSQRFDESYSQPPTAIMSNDPTKTLKDKFSITRQLNTDQVMLEALKKSGIYPDQVYKTEDNKVLPVYYKYRNILDDKDKVIGTEIQLDKNGNKVIDEDLTKPMGLDQAYLSMGYKGQTKKDLGGTMRGTYKPVENKSTQPSSKYTVNGKSYTHKQLNDMGYDDNEIDQAIKQGLIGK
jgi:hypothetical protein